MAELVRVSDGHAVDLRLHHLVGRASSCQLRLQRSEVSGVHAAFRWSASGWEVRDLGSTNGTLVDGTPLVTGRWQPLSIGSEIVFGHPDLRWILRTDTAPRARAVPADGGPVVEDRGGILALPDPDDAEVLVARGADGQWVIEDADGRVTPVGTTVRVRDRAWELELPEVDARTPLLRAAPLALRFEVSPDEEFVTLHVRCGEVEHAFGAYAHHYLLLTLARLRQRDPAPEPERGWVNIDQLSRMLRLDERPLNLQIFRIRRQFAGLGLDPAPEIVERRRGTGQVRIGDVEVFGT